MLDSYLESSLFSHWSRTRGTSKGLFLPIFEGLLVRLTFTTARCNTRYMETREYLLRRCLAYFLKHGIANLSLRPLAAALGTSPRMLLHYFGSKEALIVAVMQQAQARLQSIFQTLLSVSQSRPKQGLMQAFWNILSNRANRPIVRLLFEIQILAIQNPKRYQRYLDQTSERWRGFMNGR